MESFVYLMDVRWVLSLFSSVFCWDQRLRPNHSTLVSAGVEFNQSPQLIVADVIGGSSLILPYFFVYFWSSKKWSDFRSSKLNFWLMNVSCACKINQRVIHPAIAQSEVWSWAANHSVNRWAIRRFLTKNDFTFCLIFGLRPNLGLSESLGERLIQRVKWPTVSLLFSLVVTIDNRILNL